MPATKSLIRKSKHRFPVPLIRFWTCPKLPSPIFIDLLFVADFGAFFRAINILWPSQGAFDRVAFCGAGLTEIPFRLHYLQLFPVRTAITSFLFQNKFTTFKIFSAYFTNHVIPIFKLTYTFFFNESQVRRTKSVLAMREKTKGYQ